MNIERLMQANGIDSLMKPVTEDDLIEAVADQEYRLCCIELGIDPEEIGDEKE